MDHRIAEILQMLIGFGGGVTALVAVLRYKLRRVEIERGAPTDLHDVVESLRGEVRDLRNEQADQLADIHDRLEFAERLLTKGRGSEVS
jgi:hypothetical protein